MRMRASCLATRSHRRVGCAIAFLSTKQRRPTGELHCNQSNAQTHRSLARGTAHQACLTLLRWGRSGAGKDRMGYGVVLTVKMRGTALCSVASDSLELYRLRRGALQPFCHPSRGIQHKSGDSSHVAASPVTQSVDRVLGPWSLLHKLGSLTSLVPAWAHIEPAVARS
ncbi:hypothetical protein P171DRAFT_269525 [Karstenula rhodostoma CBS 690.94]|uniref:Uncharacterized protein n=1 Tax=Karstenula rhodostoma CBS 690.94 TaxID=1392251 RepID=A0A9P4PIF0_9PLEO|nr:hypothetical protein P171DRAFT_269525 [Karstenula rhodostoma CBS 690.94]